MSDWHGPSTYVIASAHDLKCHVALHNGDKADGTKVISYSTSIGTTSKNNHWEFVFAGHGPSGKEEYLIIGRNSGTYLSSATDLKDGACTGNTMSSRDSRIRWNVVPTRSGNGWFWIIAARDKTMALALTGAKAENDTVIKTTTLRNDDKSFAWCLLLAEDAIIDVPDVGKGSF